MIENKFTRCDPEDPNRCQAVQRNGQCPFLAVEGTKYCPRHGGILQQERDNKEKATNYKLNRYKARFIEFLTSAGIKDLREEIAILRILVEEVFNKYSDGMLIAAVPILSDLIPKIEKLVISCHKLEQSLGSLLDEKSILNLATAILEIIDTHIKDPEIQRLISIDLAQLIIKRKSLIEEN